MNICWWSGVKVKYHWNVNTIYGFHPHQQIFIEFSITADFFLPGILLFRSFGRKISGKASNDSNGLFLVFVLVKLQLWYNLITIGTFRLSYHILNYYEPKLRLSGHTVPKINWACTYICSRCSGKCFGFVDKYLAENADPLHLIQPWQAQFLCRGSDYFWDSAHLLLYSKTLFFWHNRAF